MRVNMRRMTPGAVFNSFLGILDIKLGCEIILLFGLINKVAGVYGLITVIVGGTFWQFLYYAYSFATLWAFLWALSVIKLEVAKKSLFVAHLYVIDHAIAWVFHYIFYYSYWYVLKHDGARILNSQAQKDIFDLALDRGETQPLEEGRDQQAQLAHDIWNKEKGYALGVIAVGFLLKVYFIFLMYSYAAHLRSGTYHQLPLTTHANQVTQMEARRASLAATALDEEIEMERALADVERIERGARASEEADAAPAGTALAGSNERTTSPRTNPRTVAAGAVNGSAAVGKSGGAAAGVGGVKVGKHVKGKKSRDSDEFSWD